MTPRTRALFLALALALLTATSAPHAQTPPPGLAVFPVLDWKTSHARVAVDASAGTLRPLSGGCGGGGTAVSCTATPGQASFTLELQAEVGTVVGLVLTPPEGWEDPASADNRVTLRLQTP